MISKLRQIVLIVYLHCSYCLPKLSLAFHTIVTNCEKIIAHICYCSVFNSVILKKPTCLTMSASIFGFSIATSAYLCRSVLVFAWAGTTKYREPLCSSPNPATPSSSKNLTQGIADFAAFYIKRCDSSLSIIVFTRSLCSSNCLAMGRVCNAKEVAIDCAIDSVMDSLSSLVNSENSET